jgi:CubicO group peptidase (beta-lactamase class C family)
MRLAILSLLTVAAILCSPATRADDDFVAKAEALITRHVDADGFSGVVFVLKDGKPLFRKAFGLANREWNIANDVDTVFRIGSTTKQFTAAAIMQLVERGKLSVDDKIAKYYPAAPKTWSAVTLRHLLTHSSGIPDYVATNGFIRKPARIDHTPDEYIDIVRDQPLGSAPGAKYKYTNTNYLLLGMVVEKVSGETYGDYIAKHILAPLGLTHTAFDRTDEIVPHRAAGYWNDNGTWKNARIMTLASLNTAGGLRSTVDDLLQWDQSLHAGKLLKPETVAAMFTDYGNKYGFGSFVEVRNGHRLWRHGGNVTGFSSAFERYPDDGLNLIILCNIEGQHAEKIAKELAGIYFGWPPKP